MSFTNALNQSYGETQQIPEPDSLFDWIEKLEYFESSGIKSVNAVVRDRIHSDTAIILKIDLYSKGILFESVICKSYKSEYIVRAERNIYVLELLAKLESFADIAPKICGVRRESFPFSMSVLMTDNSFSRVHPAPAASESTMKKIVEAIADLHNHFHNHEILQSNELSKRTKDPLSMVQNTNDGSFQNAWDRLKSETLPHFLRYWDLTGTDWERGLQNLVFAWGDIWMKRVSDRPFTLMHGDFHRENVLIGPAEKNNIIFIDWDLAKPGVGVFDLCYYLNTLYNKKLRRKLEAPMIDVYMKRSNPEYYVSGEKILSDYKISTINFAFFALEMNSIMIFKNAMTACEDWNILDIFGNLNFHSEA